MSLSERFWSKVDRSEYAPAGCWRWRGAGKWKERYGRFLVGPRYLQAHRVAYEFDSGPIPNGLVIRHFVCGYMLCCNPAHLKPGTPAENVADTVAMDRFPKGEDNKAAKLSDQAVIEIRGRYALGESVSALSRSYCVSRRAIRRVCVGSHWRHVDVASEVRP